MFKAGVFAAATVALSGCASATDQEYADFKTCQAQGYEPGSPAYWACRSNVADYRAGRRQAFWAGMAAVGAAMRDPPETTSPAPTIPPGFTKVCTYNTIMGQRAVTIRALELCPLLPPSP